MNIRLTNLNGLVRYISADVANMHTLSDAIAIQGGFDDSYGYNFDALWEILESIELRGRDKFVLIHEYVPFLKITDSGFRPAASDRRAMYLSILKDLKENRFKNDDMNDVLILFPRSARPILERFDCAPP